MTIQAEHFGLAATDADVLKEWYGRVLGAKALRKLNNTPPAWLLEFPGGFWIEIYTAESKMAAQPNGVAGWRHLALRVENIDAAREHLVAKGVAIEEHVKPAGGGGKVLFFSDPEGNLFHLVERPSEWNP